VTRPVKYRAATVVEGYDRAAIERGDPSIPADKLKAARKNLKLLDFIEKRFPESKHQMVEYGVEEKIRQPASEIASNRIWLAQETGGAQLGAWFPKREQTAINGFSRDFRKAVKSWQAIAQPLRERYDDLALSDERVAGDNLTQTLARLARFFEETTPAVLAAVDQTGASSSDRDRWGVIMVVQECRDFWTEQTGKPPALVAKPDTGWWNFLTKVFELIEMNVAPETATSSWRRRRGQIRLSEEQGGRMGPEIIVILPAKSEP
jgi:hypothetical protein